MAFLTTWARKRACWFVPAASLRQQRSGPAGLQIDLDSPFDTEPHQWQVTATIPAICDFRSAAMAFGLSMSAPLPFTLSRKFYEERVAFDQDNNRLGTPLEVATCRRNTGDLPRDVGESGRYSAILAYRRC